MGDVVLKHRKVVSYIVFILITLAAGGVGAIFSYNGMPGFDAAAKPALTPPKAVFPIAWTALYILMGWGMARIWLTSSRERSDALLIYAVQLIINIFWSAWFFGLQAYLFAFVWLLLLILAIVIMIFIFHRIDHAAGLMQIPYLAWCIFAAYLNFGVWSLN